jgi:HTH-type transcriptional regulator/antitoxin HigA
MELTIKPIHNDEDHKAALAMLDSLMNAEEGTQEAGSLEVLGILIHKYERERFPQDAVTPLEAIEFRMEQLGKKQPDLAALLHSRSRASEILSGKAKRLSVAQLRKLHTEWNIPADILLREPFARSDKTATV